jgi:hypothetical protein
MLTTTLNKIRSHDPCADGWSKLLKNLGKIEADDEPLPFAVILQSNGLDDALWACRSAPEHAKHWRLYAVWCARQVQWLMQDPRSVAALDMVDRHANGNATDEELAAARAAAGDAAGAARAARDAAGDAAWDARAARDAAGDAAGDAAWDAAWAARAAGDAAGDARAAGDAQKERFLVVVSADY